MRSAPRHDVSVELPVRGVCAQQRAQGRGLGDPPRAGGPGSPRPLGVMPGPGPTGVAGTALFSVGGAGLRPGSGLPGAGASQGPHSGAPWPRPQRPPGFHTGPSSRAPVSQLCRMLGRTVPRFQGTEKRVPQAPVCEGDRAMRTPGPAACQPRRAAPRGVGSGGGPASGKRRGANSPVTRFYDIIILI